MPRVRVVAYCVEPGCRCDHRAGVVLYDGPDDPATVAEARAGWPDGAGYEVVVEPVEAPPADEGYRY